MNLFFNQFIFFIFCICLFWLLEHFYFRLADRFNIIDKPNERSSHVSPVIRGGGIIFVIAIMIGEALTGFAHKFFLTGAFIIALVSFIDDVCHLPVRVRFIGQLTGILFLLYEVTFFQYDIWLVIFVIIVAVGTVNAFNFMDGINGITGTYGFVNLLTFIYINEFHAHLISESFLVCILASIVVFLVLNFRVKARCFAGDVGSITLAYTQMFLVLLLITSTNNFAWVLMFTVYGVDTIVTIVHRILRKENIFLAHRSHLYQYLANELRYPHQLIATIYGFVQLVINIGLIYFIQHLDFALSIIILTIVVGLYIFFRYRVILSIQKLNSSL